MTMRVEDLAGEASTRLEHMIIDLNPSGVGPIREGAGRGPHPPGMGEAPHPLGLLAPSKAEFG
jgi:hypothetical protein